MLYADDATIKVSHNSFIGLQLISEQFINMTDTFLNDKNLLFNSAKTNYITFDLKNQYDKQLDDCNFN